MSVTCQHAIAAGFLRSVKSVPFSYRTRYFPNQA
jgi:hypothetical protein